MGDSMLRWLGRDEPPQHRVRYKVWRKQLTGETKQLLLGANRARQGTELEMLDGTDIVREVEAAGAKQQEQEQALRLSLALVMREERAGRMGGRIGTTEVGLRALVWTWRGLRLRLRLVLSLRQSLLLTIPGGR
jgi:hypothetical protein